MWHLRKLRFIFVCLLALMSASCAGGQADGTPTLAESLVQPTEQELVPTVEQELSPGDAPMGESSRISQSVNAITGGEISLSTPNGDTVQLLIPPFALAENTDITLIALAQQLQSPFQENFFPGIAIEPDGLSLRLPATLMLSLAKHDWAPGERIFYLKNPKLAIPLWQSQQDGSSMTGKISHFSDYIGGSPSAEEAQAQAAAAGTLGGDLPSGWKDSLEGNQALNEWGNGLNEMGMGDDGSGVINQARERLMRDIECVLDLNCSSYPLDPCGDYQQMLMQYFEQATQLALDPESQLMKDLYDLLEKVLNECTNRYRLEYAHHLTVSQGGLEQDMQVTGTVLFTAPMYGKAGAVEPLQMEGSGTVSVTISGQMTGEDETCTLDGSGTNDVTITGQLEADEVGYPWMALDVSETWYTTGSMTFTCPSGVTRSVPLPGGESHTFPLRFQYEDGAKSMAPNVGGMQGEYVWILHIDHTW